MIQLAFLKARSELGRIIDKCSGCWGYCHVKIVFSDGKAFSSSDQRVTLPSGRRLHDGVRFWDSYLDYDPDPDNWRLVTLAVPEADEAIIRDWAEKTWAEGHRYDALDLLHQLLGIVPEDPQAYVCSEVCMTAFQQVIDPVTQRPRYFQGFEPAHTSPNNWAMFLGLEKAA